jgi:hypothetical protein
MTSYDYNSVVERTNKRNSEMPDIGISCGVPYGVVVLNETFDKYNKIIINEFRGNKTLQLRSRNGSILNKIRDILKDCYDNRIIIDFGKDYVLVIEYLSLPLYFSLRDNENNNNYPINYYHYQDKYVNKYLVEMGENRKPFEELIKVIPPPIPYEYQYKK